MNWVIKASVAVGLVAMAACSSTTGTGVGGGGTITTTDTGTTDTGTTDTGTTSAGTTCASLLTSDFSGWSTSYASANSDAAAFYSCACDSGTPCSLVCNDSAHPGFCAGMAPVANGQCVTCLKMTGSSGCGDQLATCMSN